jgi:hypothetical protein
MLFDTMIYRDSQEFRSFEELIIPRAWSEMDRRIVRRTHRKATRHRQGVSTDFFFESAPAELLRSSREDVGGATLSTTRDVYTLNELWFYQQSMRSDIGMLVREDSDAPLELAKDIGFITKGYSLTEFGNLIRLILTAKFGCDMPYTAEHNPLLIYDDPALRLLYLYSLLSEDVVFVGMLDYLRSCFQPKEALRGALAGLVSQLEENTRLDEISRFKGILDLNQRIAKAPVEKQQREPRLEFCVDLGILERIKSYEEPTDQSSGNEEDNRYKPTSALERAGEAFADLFKNPGAVSRWIDGNFFKAAGCLYERKLTQINSSNLKLLYFIRGAELMGPRMGFIPGRIASIAACTLAWVDGYLLEVSELFDEVYLIPKGEWSGRIKFSGGSRLDREFLVAIDSKLRSDLEAAVKTSSGS